MSSPQDQQQAIKPPGQGQSAFQDQQDAIKRTFSPAPAASPIVSCPKGALTEQQAQERFDKFKCREDIPWDYPNDCCYNRAHVMATELKAEGVDVGKVWNYAPSGIGNLLRVYTKNDPDGYVSWGYHVAPTVPVADSNGTVIRMVIDPSITDRPLTPEQWKALQGQPRSTLFPDDDAAPYYRDSNGKVYPTPTDYEVRKIFEKHRAARDENWRDKAK